MAGRVAKKLERYLGVINKHRSLNAFINVNHVQATKLAKESDERSSSGKRVSAVDGMLVAIKDNIHVAGMPNTAGTLALKNFIPEVNAPIVEKLLSAGAICLGKVNMHELAFGVTSYNYAYYNDQVGVRNAFDSSKIAGGSSGGSAVAVAMGMCDASLGSDTRGSVRIPAALNGVVGFRPSSGRYSIEGITPISHSKDTSGILAKNTKDVQLIDSFIANHHRSEEELEERGTNIRLGYDERQCLVGCSDEMMVKWKMMLKKLEGSERISLVEIDMTEVCELHTQTGLIIEAYEAQYDLVDYLKNYNTGVSLESLLSQISSPDVKAIYSDIVSKDEVETPSGDLVNKTNTYNDVMENILPKAVEAYQTLFKNYKLDGVISPTTPLAAVDASPESVFPEDVITTTVTELMAKALLPQYIHNTDIAPTVGSPSISIPILPNAGLPLGFMIDGNIGDDAHLLSIAEFVESLIAD